MRVYQFRHVGVISTLAKTDAIVNATGLRHTIFMKRIVYYFLLTTLALTATGCTVWPTPSANTNTTGNANNSNISNTANTNTTAQTYWLNYSLKQCATAPWGNNLETATISSYYQDTFDITVYNVAVTPPPEGLFTCQACGCPTGTTVSLETDAAGRAILLQNDFTEADANVSTTEPVPDAAVVAQASNSNLTPADAQLRERSERVEIALSDYYAAHVAYPDNLEVLSLDVDATDLDYTPIGSLPASYYDLVVSYSTGPVTINP